MDPACPVPECIVIGSVLCLTWASLRWNDGLWSPPSRVVLQASSLSGLATRTKSCRASMPCRCQLLGLTGTSASCWGISWVNALQQCVADTSRLFPARVVDFLLPVLSPDSTHPVFVAPLHRSRAMPWLRSLLQEHWRLHSDLPPPSEHALYGVHSCKATVLSWERQLHLDPELRRLQGHHRPSAMEGSVRVYSRDDIGPMLQLQADIINKIRSGYRPLQPVARGSNPLPDFRVCLPAPDRSLPAMPVMESTSVVPAVPAATADTKGDADTDLSADSSDSDSSVASASDPEPASLVKAPRPTPSAPPLEAFLHNPRSNVLHRPVLCSEGDARSVRIQLSGLEVFWVRPACGASVGQLSSDTWCPTPPAGAQTLSPPRLPGLLVCAPPGEKCVLFGVLPWPATLSIL